MSTTKIYLVLLTSYNTERDLLYTERVIGNALNKSRKHLWSQLASRHITM